MRKQGRGINERDMPNAQHTVSQRYYAPKKPCGGGTFAERRVSCGSISDNGSGKRGRRKKRIAPPAFVPYFNVFRQRLPPAFSNAPFHFVNP